MNEEVKKVFQPGPMVSIRSPKNLSSYLVRAKIQWKGRQDLVNARVIGVRYVSMYLKRKHLRVQWPILHIKLTIALTVTINAGYIYWYLLTLETKQYVASTTDYFRYRWNNYKCNDRKYARGEACLQEGHNGFLHDVSLTLTDKTDAKNPIKQGNYWRHTFKTLAPHGLNVEDDF